MPGAAGLAGKIKEVDLNDPFFEKIAGSVTTTADLAEAGVTSMVVKLRYGVRDDGTAPKDTQEIPLAATGDKGAYAFFMDRRRSVELEYQVVVNYKAGHAIGDTQSQVTSPWIRTTTRNLDIDPRAVGAVFPVNLVLGSVDWTSVRSVQSTVLYQSNGVKGERTQVLSQAAPPKSSPSGRPRAAQILPRTERLHLRHCPGDGRGGGGGRFHRRHQSAHGAGGSRQHQRDGPAGAVPQDHGRALVRWRPRPA